MGHIGLIYGPYMAHIYLSMAFSYGRTRGRHVSKIVTFSFSGTAHVMKMKLGMDIKYISCMSHIPVLFSLFVLLVCIQGEIIDVH